MRTVGESAFASCTNLSVVNVNVGLTTLETAAFRACTGLNSISLPSTVENMNGSPFFDCTNLTTINIDKEYNATFAKNAPWGAGDKTYTGTPKNNVTINWKE